MRGQPLEGYLLITARVLRALHTFRVWPGSMLMQAEGRGNSLHSYGARFICRSRAWKRGISPLKTRQHQQQRSHPGRKDTPHHFPIIIGKASRLFL